MTPGTYLRKRREAAGLALREAAALLATLPDAPVDLAAMQARIAAAEADTDNLTVFQAGLLRRAMPFDLQIYQDLLLRHHAGALSGLPEPRVCRTCACSWHDPCSDRAGLPCSWSFADPDLCTACAHPPAPKTNSEGVTCHG